MKKLVTLLVSVLPLTAHAGFQLVNDPPPAIAVAESKALVEVDTLSQGVVASPAASNPFVASSTVRKQKGFGLIAVNYIGDAPADIEVRKGFANDVKLIVALKQIVPAGWHAYLADDDSHRLDKAKLVTWRGGRKWPEVLDILASDQGLVIDIDWEKKKIYVGLKKISVTPAIVAALPLPQSLWIAKAGSTLRESVADWAKCADWVLKWNADDLDYPIIGDLTYQGSFQDAITGVFRAYEKSERPMLVDGSVKQRLLVVTEKK